MTRHKFSIRAQIEERIQAAQAEKQIRQTDPKYTDTQLVTKFASNSQSDGQKSLVRSAKPTAGVQPDQSLTAAQDQNEKQIVQIPKENVGTVRKAAPDRRMLHQRKIPAYQQLPADEDLLGLEIPGFTNNARQARLARIQAANEKAAIQKAKGLQVHAKRPNQPHAGQTVGFNGQADLAKRDLDDSWQEPLFGLSLFDWILDQPWIQSFQQKIRAAGTKKLAYGIVGVFALCISISVGLSGCAQPYKLTNQTFVMELGTDVYANPSLYIENADQVDLGSLSIEPRSPGITIADNRFITVSLDYLGVGQYDFVLKDGDAETPFVIKVKDTKPPTLKKSPDAIEVGWGQDVNWNEVFEATDLSGVYYEPSFDFASTPGVHSVDVKIRDRFGNATTKTITVTVTA